uniref:Myosin heavy chain n=1 Tax=Acrobeloides nanus TaxID=290746 RepID=A0A914CP08_9BILA
MNAHEKDPGWQYLRLTREQMLQETSKPYDSKKNVWIPDAEEGYVAGQIVSKKGDTVTVTVDSTGAEKTLKKDLVQEVNPPKFEKTEDMSNLTFLNDASVLHNLRSRYSAMLIYTYSGLFCVVINPYKRLPIYTDSVARMFMGKRRNEMPPHLFAVSDEAYRNMLQNRENQSMLITGESGAGKTENTKKVIAYFAAVGASQAEAAEAAAAKKEKKETPKEKRVTLEDQIVRTNPVLEAFGNAKTVRNNNSSRFGKFIRIMFNKIGKVASCDIDHSPTIKKAGLKIQNQHRVRSGKLSNVGPADLLEKSRVIRQAPGERCYHIFYQIFSGHRPDLLEILKLHRPLKDYWYVAQAELTIDGVDDKEEFGMTEESFDILLFSEKEKMDCYRIISSIMHMGIMKFKQRPREEQAEPDEDPDTEPARAAEMFGVDLDQFLNAFVKPRVRVGNEWVSKGQNVDQVSWAMGAMSKALYARMFKWLVYKCNLTLDQKGLTRDYFIGVLDIAGFEIFDLNSFEQLWINFVNEKLQQFFNHHMFVLEQEEYAREGIEWVFIDFGLDLQACIELIEKKPKPPKGKQAEAHIAMKHYAGTVRYNCINWLEKNKDPLNDTVVQVMKGSKTNQLLLDVWADYVTQQEAAESAKSGGGKKGGKSGSFMTVSMIYRESLNNLMNMLNRTHPHFIRCIIPNEKKQSGLIDAALVMNQLTCNGVLEALRYPCFPRSPLERIRICRKGFPNRMLHPDFTQRYAILASQEARSSEDPKACAEKILLRLVKDKKLDMENFRIGHTKVFFKAGIVAHVEDLRDEKLNAIITSFQCRIHWYNAQWDAFRRQKQLNSYITLQKNIRSWQVLRTWDWYRLYGILKPQLKSGKWAEEMERLGKEAKELEENLAKEEAARKLIEAEHKKLSEERQKLLEELQMSMAGSAQVEQKLNAINAARMELERSLSDQKDKLSEQQQRGEEENTKLRRAQKDKDNLNNQIGGLNDNLKKLEDDKKAKEDRIRQLQEDMTKQDEAIAQSNREKKRNEEENRKLAENLQAEEEKNAQASRLKLKLEREIEDIEDSLDRERRHRSEVEKAKKKLEADLTNTQEQIDEINRRKAEIEGRLSKVDEDLRGMSARLEEEQGVASKTSRQLKDQHDRM